MDWIDVIAAWDCIEQQAPVLSEETCALDQACGRVLSQTIHTDRDLPPFDRAAMDGFAVRAADIAMANESTPVRLRVVGEATPGQAGPSAASAATALRIMTGAAVPAGWDCVVPVELTSGFQDNPVTIRKALPKGQHIAARAAERPAGHLVYEAGHRLGSADMGALAMLGCMLPQVTRRPVVGILATGNELIDPSGSPGPLQIRNSNSIMLQAQCAMHAAHFVHCGTAPDDATELRRCLEAGLQSDVLLVTGGVSAGAYDFVEDLLADLGVRIEFRKVAVQPGKPVTFGVHPHGCVLALPGNPVSAWTTMRLFGVPLLLRMQGARRVRPIFERLIADFSWQRRNSKWLLFPGMRQEDRVRQAPYSGSGDLLALAAADGQVVLPPQVERVVPGDTVLFWPQP
jgi:molybdopterin molybdotransferase